MHIDHEHGHSHGDGDHAHSQDHDRDHDHSHEHTHEHEHKHSHHHTHGHTHREGGHSHGHDHSNDNPDGDGGAQPDPADAADVSEKDVALLKYMLEHNKQHAKELLETGGRLKASGAEEAAVKIDEAVHYFEHANEMMEKSISLIGGGR